MTQSGWHFLQIPGPTNVPDRVLRAMARPTIDHRGPEFAALTLELIAGLRRVFKTADPVVIYPGSGSGASEAAYVNTLSPGDRIIVFETGHFAWQWKRIAERLGVCVDYVAGNWRRGASDDELESRLSADRSHEIKAVVVVHNETSTGVASRIPDLRNAIDRAKHPALLIVDAVSSLASFDYRHDEWGVDVTVCGSQKGLMVPPGLGFCAISKKARAAQKDAKLPRHYFDWDEMLTQNEKGFFPYTPATNLFYGLHEALQMLDEEGLDNVFARHARHGDATRAAVRAWGLEIVCEDPREYSNSMTAVFMPEGHNADELRKVILDRFNMSLGVGLSKFAGKVFRIGHLGSFNDLMLAGTLAGVEMGLRAAGVPHREGGVMAALQSLSPIAEAAPAR
jgi:alanine-glyoxylate transaminase/serine-glyoxylate transaminase/serine-pyruvate transaminase